jgi:hypothetical protein
MDSNEIRKEKHMTKDQKYYRENREKKKEQFQFMTQH